MLEKFEDTKVHGKTKEMIKAVNKVIRENDYLFFRQLYYILVKEGVIQNSVSSYKNVVRAITSAKLSGMVDWMAIRDCDYVQHDKDVDGHAVELWVDSHIGACVAHETASSSMVPVFVHKVNAPQSFYYHAAKRWVRNKPTLLYLGDYAKDNKNSHLDLSARLSTFARAPVPVRHIGLTAAHIMAHNPPNNPFSIGRCYETAAMPGSFVRNLIQDALP